MTPPPCAALRYDFGRPGCTSACDGLSTASCGDWNWHPQESGTTLPLLAVWGHGPNNVLAVGDLGTIVRYDGQRWEPLDSHSPMWLGGVWGSGPRDVFAVGDRGTILHYDGERWEPMESPEFALLLGVWGSGPEDVFAVGESGTLLRYDVADMTAMRGRGPERAFAAAKLFLSIALLCASAAPARAEAPPFLPPWHQGVSEERKQRALSLFREARDLHRRMMLAEARMKYQEALASWEHPELRLYLGRVLRSIGLPLLAHENLRLSLQWGPGSLTLDQEQEARSTLRALVQHELAAVRIRCDERGAAVLLDGKPWFVGPGVGRRMVTPGEHVITARKEGYFTVVKPVLVLAGKEASGHIALSIDAVITERRWAPWVPWATLGTGAALGVVGAGLWWQADVDHREADRRLGGGCDPTCAPSPRDEYDRSIIENRLAIGAFIAGGAAVISGAVLLLMNGPQSHRTEDRGGVQIELLPVLSGDVASLSVRLAL